MYIIAMELCILVLFKFGGLTKNRYAAKLKSSLNCVYCSCIKNLLSSTVIQWANVMNVGSFVKVTIINL